MPFFFHLGGKSYQSKKHFPSETDLSHTYIPLLPGAARLLLTFDPYLPQFGHVKKQTQICYLRLDKAHVVTVASIKHSRRAFMELMGVCLRKEDALALNLHFGKIAKMLKYVSLV